MIVESDKCFLDIINSNITIEEIEFATKKLKNGKSPGIDRIPVEFIKQSIDLIKYDLQMLFNYVIASEVYPDAWGEGLRVAIPKGKDDIRPITIEPIFAKLFETIIDNRITFANEAFCKVDIYNGGFLKGSMTQDNLLILTSCIQKQLCTGKRLFVAFIDFKKAFNFVNHTILFYKLAKAGITGRALNLLRDMYSKIKAIVKVKNRLFEWIKDYCGTNQGGPLSPNMFRFILTDLREFLDIEFGIVLEEETIAHLLWADDLVLMSDSQVGLQTQLNNLFKFCSKFQMIVNETKTKIMVYGNYDEDTTFTFNDKTLEIVDEYKYLGVVLNSCRNIRGNIFKKMIPYITEKGRKATFATVKKCRSLGFLSPKVALQLFDSNVLSILSYASEIWSGHKLNEEVEKVHLRFLKFILGVKDSTCTTAVYGEIGRFPLQLDVNLRTIKYWIRILKAKDESLVKKAFLTLKHLDDAGFVTWASSIRNILTKYNLSNIWDDPSIVINETDRFIFDLKDQMYSEFIEDWSRNLSSFPKLRSYITYKSHFSFEYYLFEVKEFKLRRYIAKVRLSSHDFQIEKGRYDRTPVEERLCTNCNLRCVEDEYHVLLQCPRYKDDRQRFKEEVFKIEPNFSMELNSILGSNNGRILFCLGKYLQKIFRCRRTPMVT